MAPEGTEHSYFGQTLADIFRIARSNRALVRENNPITLTDSEPIPDIAIVRLRYSAYRLYHPHPEDIFSIVEISQSTFTFDTIDKKATYAAAGIQEYWIWRLKMFFTMQLEKLWKKRIG